MTRLEIAAFPPIMRRKSSTKKNTSGYFVRTSSPSSLASKMKETFEPMGIPVGTIAPETYGMMDGEKR